MIASCKQFQMTFLDQTQNKTNNKCVASQLRLSAFIFDKLPFGGSAGFFVAYFGCRNESELTKNIPTLQSNDDDDVTSFM